MREKVRPFWPCTFHGLSLTSFVFVLSPFGCILVDAYVGVSCPALPTCAQLLDGRSVPALHAKIMHGWDARCTKRTPARCFWLKR